MVGSRKQEDEILAMLASPDMRRNAFSMIVSQYSEPLYHKIRRIVLDHEDASDVLQNTMLKAWSNIDTFQSRAQLSTWLYRIAINEALDFLRRHKVSSKVITADDVSVGAKLMSDRYFEGDRTQALLQEAIATLPDVQRTVFTLRYYDEMKYAEMSQILQTSEGALKASYHIAVKKIKEYVVQHGQL